MGYPKSVYYVYQDTLNELTIGCDFGFSKSQFHLGPGKPSWLNLRERMRARELEQCIERCLQMKAINRGVRHSP